MLIDIIAGARPNFMKIAPIIEQIKKKELEGHNIHYRLIHTGQHYDKNMSGDFFEQLGIPEPDVNLGAGGGSQAEQTAAIMIGFEKELAANPADLVLVVGDVTSSMACAIVAKKLNTKVAHVEAGIRSFDLTMPEEINRMVTDSITDYFFTTSATANSNLRKAGMKDEQIFFVGNTMIDTLLKNMSKFKRPAVWEQANLKEKEYFVITLHRPANVDGEYQLKNLLEEIVANTKGLPVVFPVHPRTAKVLEKLGLQSEHLVLTEPLSYLEFNYLVKYAKAVLTDSGGITEENTERPETCEVGTNELIGTDKKAIKPSLEKLFAGNWKKGGIPELWDGKTAERIVEALLNLGNTQQT